MLNKNAGPIVKSNKNNNRIFYAVCRRTGRLQTEQRGIFLAWHIKKIQYTSHNVIHRIFSGSSSVFVVGSPKYITVAHIPTKNISEERMNSYSRIVMVEYVFD